MSNRKGRNHKFPVENFAKTPDSKLATASVQNTCVILKSCCNDTTPRIRPPKRYHCNFKPSNTCCLIPLTKADVVAKKRATLPRNQ